MSERAKRFRRLDPPGRRNGDLFEHFGVAVDPAGPGAGPLPEIRAVHACPACGWYRDVEGPCDACGDDGHDARAAEGAEETEVG